MLIKVQLNTGYTIDIDINVKDTVLDIKNKIYEQEGIDPQQQRLVYEAQQLHNSKTAGDIGLRAGITLQMVINLRGG